MNSTTTEPRAAGEAAQLHAKIYDLVYAQCEAGGMRASECHEVALQEASRASQRLAKEGV